ncbi:hypothetical protein BKA62DRAFT_202953 [Auriculariales sp. MPI-PUGE-AT-0066]|nr:hypothetical protein BKA62DRAFT_202953 [Auriculariales sp. MPI-PUGE-AT-0066]
MAPRRFSNDGNEVVHDAREVVHSESGEGAMREYIHAVLRVAYPQGSVQRREAQYYSPTDAMAHVNGGAPPATVGVDETLYDDGTGTINAGIALPAAPEESAVGQSSTNNGAQATLATAAISAAFAVGTLSLLAGAMWLMLHLRKKRRDQQLSRWGSVDRPSMRNMNISAPIPLFSSSPYTHLSDISRMSVAPRPAPSRKPVPQFVIGEEDDSTLGADGHTYSMQKGPAMNGLPPLRPLRKSSADLMDDGSTPTQAYFQQPMMQPGERSRSIVFSVASTTTIYSRPAGPLQSAPAAATVYPQGMIIDEPSPYIKTAPLVPVNPFSDPETAPVGRRLSSIPESGRVPRSQNPFRESAATAVSTANSANFQMIEIPQYDNRTPPSLPASALGTAQTATETRFNPIDIDIDQFPLPPSTHSNKTPLTGKNRMSKAPAGLRISTFPYALPNVAAAPSSASTLATREASPLTGRSDASQELIVTRASVLLMVQPPTAPASRTSELLVALGLAAHTPAFDRAGFQHVEDLADKSPAKLRGIAPSLTAEDAESLVVAVDDALRNSARTRNAPAALFP